MPLTKPKLLFDSSEILYWPNGEINEETLESLLEKATDPEYPVDRETKVVVTRHRRVRNFNEKNPEYVNVPIRIKLKHLFGLYKIINREEYERPSPSDIETKYRIESKLQAYK